MEAQKASGNGADAELTASAAEAATKRHHQCAQQVRHAHRFLPCWAHAAGQTDYCPREIQSRCHRSARCQRGAGASIAGSSDRSGWRPPSWSIDSSKKICVDQRTVKSRWVLSISKTAQRVQIGLCLRNLRRAMGKVSIGWLMGSGSRSRRASSALMKPMSSALWIIGESPQSEKFVGNGGKYWLIGQKF